MARTRVWSRYQWTWILLLVAACPLSAQESRDSERQRRPSWLNLRLGRHWTRVHSRDHRTVLTAFREVVQEARRSTVRVFSSDRPDRQIALGTIVSADGYVFTKASELHGDLECQLSDDRRVAAEVVAQHRAFDLALLKLDAERLVPARWSDHDPRVGAWLASADVLRDPAAIGVVSAASRRLPAARAVLGVRLEPTELGPRVLMVFPDSAADEAAIQIGDVITTVNGQSIDSPDTLTRTIRDYRPGERVELAIRRGAEELSVSTLLGDLATIENEQAVIMESLGGPLSARRTGFPLVLQHDTVLRPRECGGPLVDLDGRVVGINIARASRVASYAIPAQLARGILEDMQADLLLQEKATAVLQTSSTGL